MTTFTHTLTRSPVLGDFSLERTARLGFGRRGTAAWDGAMRMAFCVDSSPAGPYAGPPASSCASPRVICSRSR